MISQDLIENIWMFSPLDKILTDFKNDKRTFVSAYERKEIILGLIK
jgi:hypothetical protein